VTVLVFGSINMDLTAYVPWLPRAGETIFGESVITVPGGKGANQAVAAARLGARVRMFGRVGRDAFGGDLLAALASEGVQTDGVLTDSDHPTGLAMIHVDGEGENTIVVISGANMALDKSDVNRCASALDSAEVLLLQLEVPLEANLAIAREARRRGVIVILDPAPSRQLPAELFPLLDVITPNEGEVEPLLGFPVRDGGDAARAAAQLRSLGCASAVVKLGSRGSYLDSRDRRGLIPPFPVEVVDSVAAGDAFNGGLAAALAEGKELPEALSWASAAGALAVTREGAIPSLPRRDELERMLRSRADER
jgi:ribokinase